MAGRRRFTDDELNQIYDRTSGRCHICHKRVAFKNYGIHGARGAWHVEHSIPIVNGGTNRMNNLYAAHIVCNLQKGVFTTRMARSWAGKSRAPLNSERRAIERQRNAWGGAAVGAGIGAALGGPRGALFGAIICAMVGHERNPDA